MSLINQALRKAQQQRTPSRPATAADHASASPTNYRGNFNQSGLLIGLVAGIALLIGLVAGLTIVVLRKDPAPVTQQAATLPAPVKQIAPATPAPTQPLEQGSPSVLNDLRLARVAAEAKAAADATSAKQVEAAKQLAATKAAAKPSQDIIQWLGKSKISGVRLSTSGNKVILNNKAYSVGETVNLGLGLKVLIIQEKRILFIDPNGKKYLKQL